jgi:hypothetical protein
MLEIKKILEQDDTAILLDNHLNWGNANLSSYQKIVEEYGNKAEVEIYGIELHESGISSIPENYHRIDHHNDLCVNPSSLEQIAEIVSIKLTREQQLIAANDKGYIPEMQKQGATPEEIDQIRFRDRKAQDVTKEDEQKAQEAVENKTVEQGIILIANPGTNRFSPICDRLFPYEKLLIYTEDELMYYGKGKEQLAVHYQAEIKDGKMFHGGEATGYIGTVSGIYSKEEIIDLKETIIQIINKL